MRTFVLASLFTAIILLPGCVRSLAPLFTEEEALFEPRLVGSWNVGADDAWTFSRSGDREYTLRIAQQNYTSSLFAEGVPGDTGIFTARLGRLGNDLFLDLAPAVKDDRQLTGKKNDFYNWHFLPVHSIFRVRFVHDSLRLTILDKDWLRKELEGGREHIAHIAMGSELVVTASTGELQELVRRHADDDGAFLPIDRIGHKYH